MTKKVNKNLLTKKVANAEQCFLVGNVPSLVEEGDNNANYESIPQYHLAVNGSVAMEEIIGNVFSGGPDIETFFDIEEEEYSYLTPRIRLFRVNDFTKPIRALNQKIKASEARLKRQTTSRKKREDEIKKQQAAVRKKLNKQNDQSYQKFQNRVLKSQTQKYDKKIDKTKKQIENLKKQKDEQSKKIKKVAAKTPEILEYKFETFQDSAIINQIVNGKQDRVQEAGIQSCNISLKGKNQVSAERHIDANLTFFFSSIETLLTNGTGGLLAPKYLNLFNRASSELINGVTVHFKLLLYIGYEIPDDGLKHITNKARAEKLKKAVEKMNKVYMLSVVSHEMSFSQEGHVTISAKYVASVQDVMSKIYFSKSLKTEDQIRLENDAENANALIQLHQERQKVAKEIINLYERNLPPRPKVINSDGTRGAGARSFWGTTKAFANATYRDWRNIIQGKSLDGQFDDPKRDLQKLFEETGKKLEKYDIAVANLRKMQKFINKDEINRLTTNLDKLKNINLYLKKFTRRVTINQEELASVIGVKDNNLRFKGPDIKKLHKQTRYNEYLAQQNKIKKGENKLDPDFNKSGAAADFVVGVENTKKTLKKGGSVKKIEKEMKKIVKDIVDKGASQTKNVYDVDYCFLGEIYDAIYDSVLKNQSNDGNGNMEFFDKNNRIVLGNTTFRSYNRDGSSDLVKISLSNIPVSIKYFNSWFISTIVDKGSSRVSFQYLFNQFALSLLKGTLGKSCFASQDKAFKVFPNSAIMNSTYTIRTSKCPFGGAGPGEAIAGLNIKKSKYNFSEDKEITTTLTYTVLGTRITGLDLRRMDVVNDINNGIFHFHLGRDNGLVKEIKFELKNVKAQEEVALTTTAATAQLDVFRRIYNVQLDLFGNTALQPGQTIYVSADSISKNKTFPLELGLGGYYVVVGVDHAFSPEGFFTNVSGIWIGFGLGNYAKNQTIVKKYPPPKIQKNKEKSKASQEIEDIMKTLNQYKSGKLAVVKGGRGGSNTAARSVVQYAQKKGKSLGKKLGINTNYQISNDQSNPDALRIELFRLFKKLYEEVSFEE